MTALSSSFCVVGGVHVLEVTGGGQFVDGFDVGVEYFPGAFGDFIFQQGADFATGLFERVLVAYERNEATGDVARSVAAKTLKAR